MITAESRGICFRIAPLLFAFALVAVSCGKPDAPKTVEIGNAVAVVAGEKITVERLRDELARQHRHDRSNPTTSQKLAALEALIQTDALYAKAKAAGFDRTPEMESRIKNLIATQFKEVHFTSTNSTVAEQEIEQFYSANKGRYATPLAVRVAVILLETPEHATSEKKRECLERAESVLTEAKAAVTEQQFADVVRRHSVDQATRYRGGEIGWLSRGGSDVDEKLLQALSGVEKAGDFAPLIPTPRGLFIVKLLERKEAGYKPLSEVQDAIRYQLGRLKAQQAEERFQTSIKQGLDIQINQQLLETITLPLEKQEPPKMPRTQTAQLRQ